MRKMKLLVLDPRDNVGIALVPLQVGATVTVSVGARDYTVVVRDEIRPLHKVALDEIPEGAQVVKHGHMIGRAMHRIRPGMHVHTHNLEDDYGLL
jgi:hypothetical protein